LWVSRNGQKKIKLEEEADSEILIADTNSGNQVRRLAIWKTIFRKKNERNNNSSGSKPQQKSPQQTLVSEITNSYALPRVLLAAKESLDNAPDMM
jgi:hypothetical protein